MLSIFSYAFDHLYVFFFLFHFLKFIITIIIIFLLYNICMSSLRNYLFRYSAHFLIWLFVFLTLSYKSYLYTWDINPLSITLQIFSSICGFSFHFVSDFLCWEKVFKFINKVLFVYFWFYFHFSRK